MFDGTLSHENYDAIRHERERAILDRRRLRELREIEAHERSATSALRRTPPTATHSQGCLPAAEPMADAPIG